jgi:hypothetical protein
MQRSKLVLGLVVALGVGGLGAAAVAMENDTSGAGSLADDTTTTVVVDPSTTVPTTVAPTTTLAPVADPAASPSGTDGTDPGVDRSTDGCDGATYANHGQYVSSIAKGEDRQPGDVPAAAQSDCGKPLSSVGDDEGDGAEPPEAPEASAPESGDDAGNPGQGNGNCQGNGNGASGK